MDQFYSELYNEYLASDLVQKTEDVLTMHAIKSIAKEFNITPETPEKEREDFWSDVYDYHYMNM